MDDARPVVEIESFVDVAGQHIDRAVFPVNGHEIQVIAYDQSPYVTVYIDGRPYARHIKDVDSLIRNKTA